MVIVLLGFRDVVIELVGDGLPQGVHDAEHGVTGFQRVGYHPHRIEVIHLFEGDAFSFHLRVRSIQVLEPAFDPGLNFCPRQLCGQGFYGGL